MIRNLISRTTHITVDQSGTAWVPNNGPMTGMVRYNSSNNCLEIYDGSSWIMNNAYATVGLSGDATSAIDWAIKKMAEEQRLKVLMEKHPGLKDLHDKFEMMKALCIENENI